MNLIRSRLFIYAAVVALLVIIQLFRMDVFVGVNNAPHVPDYQYDQSQAIKLAAAEKADLDKKRYLVLHNGQESDVLLNLVTTLNYLQVEHTLVNTTVDPPAQYGNYDTVILLEHDDYASLDMIDLLSYVWSGGKLLYFANQNYRFLMDFPGSFGVKDWGEDLETNDVFFNTELLTGISGELQIETYDDNPYYYFAYLDLSVQDDCLVHMESWSGTPLIWEKTLGVGKVMALNFGRYQEKANRGLLAGALSAAEGLMVYPIINSQVIFIDDFPADYISTPPLLQQEYARNMSRFILEIWWPDMVALMKKYGLKYTCAYVEHYTDEVEEPFIYNKLSQKITKQIVEDIFKYGGEVCFHGYNHQPLIFDSDRARKVGYRAWPNDTNMTKGIQTTMGNFQAGFPNYKLYTYVPPSNLLDQRAIPALIKGMPDLTNISGLYFPDLDENYYQNPDTFIQEFGFDERYGVSLPRVASGSFYTNKMKYEIASVVTLNGVINHFVHPDDVLDPERSEGLLWEQLYRETDNFFGALHDAYGWIAKDTAASAAEKVKQYVNADLYYSLRDGVLTITCDNFNHEVAVLVYSTAKITAAADCQVTPMGAGRYLVLMHKNKVTLGVQW